MQRDIIHAFLSLDPDGYTAECAELAVVTQGSTLHDVICNLNDALALHLEGEDLAAMGLSSHPRVQLIVEAPPTV